MAAAYLCVGGSQAGQWIDEREIRNGYYQVLTYRSPGLAQLMQEPMAPIMNPHYRVETYKVLPWAASGEEHVHILIPASWSPMQAIRELIIGYTRRRDDR
jgi:hypothetical protein